MFGFVIKLIKYFSNNVLHQTNLAERTFPIKNRGVSNLSQNPKRNSTGYGISVDFLKFHKLQDCVWCKETWQDDCSGKYMNLCYVPKKKSSLKHIR